MEEIQKLALDDGKGRSLGTQALRDFYQQADPKVLNSLITGESARVTRSHCVNLELLKTRLR
jgi:hypothetical protein